MKSVLHKKTHGHICNTTNSTCTKSPALLIWLFLSLLGWCVIIPRCYCSHCRSFSGQNWFVVLITTGVNGKRELAPFFSQPFYMFHRMPGNFFLTTLPIISLLSISLKQGSLHSPLILPVNSDESKVTTGYLKLNGNKSKSLYKSWNTQILHKCNIPNICFKVLFWGYIPDICIWSMEFISWCKDHENKQYYLWKKSSPLSNRTQKFNLM